jgi:hypothetical protein
MVSMIVAVERISIPTLSLQRRRCLCWSYISVLHCVDCLDEGPLLLTNVFRYFARNVQIQGNHYTVIIFLEHSSQVMKPRPSFAISLTAEQISQCVNFKFNKLKWRVGSVASNWNPANNWCQRWVKVLPQSINQDHNSSMEGQEPSNVEVRSRAKLQKGCNSKCVPM